MPEGVCFYISGAITFNSRPIRRSSFLPCQTLCRVASTVRIERDENLQSGIRGCYPCGEGAGYAGGITSAAMDGIRVAEQIASQFAPLQR